MSRFKIDRKKLSYANAGYLCQVMYIDGFSKGSMWFVLYAVNGINAWMLFCKVKEVISMQWLEKIYGINCIKTEDLVPLRYLDSRTKVHVNMH